MAIAARRGRVPLPGSERKPVPDAKPVGKADPDERIEVTIHLKSRAGAVSPRAEADGGEVLSRAEFRERMGADPANILKVEKFAHDHGLEVVQSSVTQSTVRVAGAVSAMSKAFSVALKSYRKGNLRYRGRTGAIFVPKALADIVEGVLGLDDRPQTEPHFRLFHPDKAVKPRRASRKAVSAAKGAVLTPLAAQPHAFRPTEVAALYDFPGGVDGTGQCIGIIELGGGYVMADLKQYFAKLGIPLPSITAVSVLGAGNSPTGDPKGPDGEVMLDIEVAGAVAPGAKIVVYFAPNTTQGLTTALNTAIHDSIHNPSVVSLSWGNPEKVWTGAAMTIIDIVARNATQLGITICCASGDNGSSDTDPPDTRANADFPSSSPHVMSCGGTRLIEQNGAIFSEVTWNTPPPDPHYGATGGGISEKFPKPAYQAMAGVPNSANPNGGPGRGVPDVAGDADPASGYYVRVDGVNKVYGGTSAVAPLWAGLIARMNEALTAKGKMVGFLTPKLYAAPIPTQAFHDIILGNNGDYAAKKGWDACTGLGSPIGSKLLQSL